MLETVKWGQDPRPGIILPSWYPRRKHRLARKQEGMLWIPHKGGVLVQHNTGAVGDITPGTAITPGNGSKGSATEIFASTSFDSYWMYIMVTRLGFTSAARRACLDILIGGATEEILIPDLLAGFAGQFGVIDFRGPKVWEFPLYVPAGSRIAARAQSTVTSTFEVAVYLYGGNGSPPFTPGGKVTTYGITAPDGVAITPGASAAEGAWTEITASSAEDHFALVPSFQIGNDTTTNARVYSVDIGIGSATEEQVGEGYIYCTDDNETMDGPFPSMPVFQDIPSGTRLVMRASNNGSNDGAYNGALHGVS